MSGHVFVVHSDLMRIACDAWLVPGDGSYVPGSTWERAVGGQAEPYPRTWSQAGTRCVRWLPLRSGDPEPWLTYVVTDEHDAGTQSVASVREFLPKAAEGRASRRSMRLLALPLVGTGGGGAKRLAGAVARKLLPELEAFVAAHDVDVALVVKDPAAYAAVQAARGTDDRHWSALSPELRRSARAIGARMSRGEVVLFLGAGLGKGAGLEDWKGLLTKVATEVGMSAEARRRIEALDVLDQASLIEQKVAGPDTRTEFRKRVATAVSSTTRFALSHALLATTPVREVITTNYDRLFELASQAIGADPALLPWDRPRPDQRWVLKLHGDVEHPADIVLTRGDYLAYRGQREALAGIVQSLLITRHMLVVGYSLTDLNFHQMMHAVRQATASWSGRPEHSSIGTALFLAEEPISELWAGEFDWVAMQEAAADDAARLRAARTLEIYLDCVAAAASPSMLHLLDPYYADVLSEPERRLRDLLVRLTSAVDREPPVKATAAWVAVAEVLRRLGARNV